MSACTQSPDLSAEIINSRSGMNVQASAAVSDIAKMSYRIFPASAKERNMAFCSAYFDESTSEKSLILIVAGFLSTDARWQIFEQEWKEVLAEFKITAFHAQHFAKHKEEFQGWEESKRRALIGKLLRIISERAWLGFASVVYVNEFERYSLAMIVAT